MIAVDWLGLLLGLLLGLVVSSVFFIGLAWGMKLALASNSPNRKLLLSFLLRLSLLLSVGFGLTAVTTTLWPLLGYALAYFIVRFIAIRRAKMEISDAAHAR